ncbi:apolipoprotein N-acyltransferase [Streptoalloteichus tenebrarius]|uniref:Apolipoprotein N-acyltransferase n=1 Tax=Streptoalloteichus tenebrarius (strain ATCC 17920 / DSM 40477 / JCM 4838 / CBS 697.72 / NBRC 16177 / NCIMB 11028 / NRRL B-12390 / A12253. 1 / ISP 5477) TaxID=1933 RepID=A0ABT1HPT8_STRSD|nr:apolipoprotein N-acyltransferase [Streptoalloteichus tenebrarius]BFE98470.1 apolipoprotein N-acyltransferase [Streptoalloteichus tenebrarius]
MTSEQSATAPRGARRRRLPTRAFVLRLLGAVAAGLTLFASFPPRPLWWLAPLAFVLLGLVVHGRRARAGFGYGVVFGAAFLGPLLWWTGTYVGVAAPLALTALESLFFGVGCAAVAATSRLRGAPVWAAALWVGADALRARLPFGGFPWGKVAFGQPEGVFLPLAAVGGTALLSFAVTLCGFGLAALARTLLVWRRGLGRPRWWGPGLAAVAPVLAGAVAGPLVVSTAPESGTATAAVVQGNVPRLGLDFNAQRRAVLDNHVRRTEELAQAVREGRVRQPDLVIWPENSSDIDPYRNADAWAEIQEAVRQVNAPVSVGAVLVPPTGSLRNTAILWEPRRGPVAEYTKRQLQPFGETLPLRGLMRLVAPEFVDKLQHEFGPGQEAVSFPMGPARVGLATCYEVAFDWAVTDTVRSGAQVLAIPTNNATFGFTDMTYQQLAMSRVRAVEHGRTVLVAATSGVSAVVLPDGSVARSTALFTPDVLVENVPLRTTATLATRLGAVPEWALTALGAAALGWVMVRGVARRRGVAGAPVAVSTGTADDPARN